MNKMRLLYDANGFPIQGVFCPNSSLEQTVVFNTPFVPATMRVAVRSGFVRVWSTANCNLAFGDSTVVATVANMLLVANTPEYFAVPGGYIAVIGTAGAGNLYITPMN
jgi:hypothetical protein